MFKKNTRPSLPSAKTSGVAKKFFKPKVEIKKTAVPMKKTASAESTDADEAEEKKSFTIYVGNLNYKRSEQGLADLFRKYGRVKKVHMLNRGSSKLKMGIAFVQMYDEGEAFRAIKGLNGALVDGRTLKVSQANEFGKEAETKITYKARLGGSEKKTVATEDMKRPLRARKDRADGERALPRSPLNKNRAPSDRRRDERSNLSSGFRSKAPRSNGRGNSPKA